MVRTPSGTGRQVIRTRVPLGSSTATSARPSAAFGAVGEDGRLVAVVEVLPGVGVHQQEIAVEGEHHVAGPPPGLQILLKQLLFQSELSVSSAARIWSAVVFANAISNDPASLRQQVRSMAPTVLPLIGCLIGTPAQREVLEILRVVLVPEHVHRAAALERRTDAVGARELFGVAEPRREIAPGPGAGSARCRRSAAAAPARPARSG